MLTYNILVIKITLDINNQEVLKLLFSIPCKGDYLGEVLGGVDLAYKLIIGKFLDPVHKLTFNISNINNNVNHKYINFIQIY